MKLRQSLLTLALAAAVIALPAVTRADEHEGEEMNVHNNTGHEVVVFLFQDADVHTNEHGGFTVTRVVEREGVMRFADGTALLNHHFIKLGFLDGWKKVVPGREPIVFARLRDALNDLAARQGELRLTIPMAYIEARATPLR